MYTSVGLLALAAFAQSAVPEKMAWQRDYSKAQQQAVRESKPLAVVVGKGSDGFEKLAQEGKLGDEVQKVLGDSYVCVYLDADNASQSKLIGDLSIKSGKGIVIGDRKGEIMAFHHDGTLPLSDLQRHLKHFANPTVEIRTTQTHNPVRTSYYPSGSTTNGSVSRSTYCPT